MRLGGRLAAAIEILDDLARRHRPAADAMRDWGLSHRFAGSGDRAAIGNIVYDGLRRRRSAAWLLDAQTPRAEAIGALLLEWGMTAAAINAALAGDRFAPPPLSDGEAASIAARDLMQAPDAVRADCPDWCIPFLQRAFGAEWVLEGAALAARPPLDLRVNTPKAGRSKVIEALASAGAGETAIAPRGVRIAPVVGGARHPNVQVEPAFLKGWFEVQDEGSQVAATLAAALAGGQVLDYCAGAGGKTLALSAAMENRGQIFAHDTDKTRIAPIFERLRRAGSRNVQVMPTASLAPLEGAMDLVLVDAPCTGSGTWRRRPDAKWRLTGRQLDIRRDEQASILGEAGKYVKPGGRLAYVTCSVFVEENTDRVAAFLQQNPEFVPVDHGALWSSLYPGKGDSASVEAKAGISLTPARSGTDGFYFAGLRRLA